MGWLKVLVSSKASVCVRWTTVCFSCGVTRELTHVKHRLSDIHSWAEMKVYRVERRTDTIKEALLQGM